MVSSRVLQEEKTFITEKQVYGVKNTVSGHKHNGQRFYGQMSLASSCNQPDQMSESEGDVGKNMYLLALLQLWNMEEEE